MELAGRATEASDLRDRIMNPNVAKSEAEWWASREIERLEACIREMVEWRPIETAPALACMGIVAFFEHSHDAISALGRGRDERYELAWFDGTDWRESGTAHLYDERDPEHRPTHWLPLPPAPGAEA